MQKTVSWNWRCTTCVRYVQDITKIPSLASVKEWLFLWICSLCIYDERGVGWLHLKPTKNCGNFSEYMYAAGISVCHHRNIFSSNWTGRLVQTFLRSRRYDFLELCSAEGKRFLSVASKIIFYWFRFARMISAPLLKLILAPWRMAFGVHRDYINSAIHFHTWNGCWICKIESCMMIRNQFFRYALFKSDSVQW